MGTEATPVSSSVPSITISRNSFWGGLLSVVLTIAGSGYSYVSSLKSTLEGQARDIAVLTSRVDALSHGQESMDHKIDRLLLRDGGK